MAARKAKKVAAPAPTMTYRQWLIGQAMTGLLAHPKCGMVGPGHEARTAGVAREAVACADAVLGHLAGESANV